MNGEGRNAQYGLPSEALGMHTKKGIKCNLIIGNKLYGKAYVIFKCCF